MPRRLFARSHAFAGLLALILLAGNLMTLPRFAAPEQWAPDLGVFAPIALVAMATTPSVLGGGLDVSVGPLANFVAICYGLELLPHGLGSPAESVPICLGIGLAVGTVNGVLVAVLRYQPIIATLCMFIVLGGIDLMLAPAAVPLPANWTSHLSGTIGPVPGGLVLLVAAGLVWFALARTPYRRTLHAVGDDDVAAYSAGAPVAVVKVISYAVGGLLAALAGFALVGLVESADPTYGQQYALIGIAGVALGGTSLRGGRGGLTGSLLGALTIYLAQNLMLSAHVNIQWVQVVYGAFLIAGVAVSTLLGPLRRRRGAA